MPVAGQHTRSPEPTGCDLHSFGALSASIPGVESVRPCKYTSLKLELLMTSSEADLGVSSPVRVLLEESVKERSNGNRSDGSDDREARESSKSSAANIGGSFPHPHHYFGPEP